MDPVTYIEQTYSLQLKRACRDEFCGPCPFCGGVDRFRIWKDKGNFYCRPGPGHCGRQGFVDELTGETLTSEQRRLLALESKQRELERQQREQEKRLTALEKMARCTDHLLYHQNLAERDPDNVALDYWLAEGITLDSIARYKLGVCFRCPTDREGRPSYTIPVYGRDGETLINIRHRLMHAPNGDKYRPHTAGLGAQLFNSHFTNGHSQDRSQIIVTEGEKKSVVLDQEGFCNVAIMGKRAFKKEWIEWLEPFRAIYVALDPDAAASAKQLAAMFNERGRVVHLPCKPDDFFSLHKGTRNDFEHFLETARPVRA